MSFEVLKECSDESFASINKNCKNEENLTRKQIVEKHGDLVRITQLEGNGKYSYNFGEKYPGLIVGHGKCKDDNCLVPKYMGWLWNVESLGVKKVRKGWCPGAIPEPVKEIMNSFLNSNPLNCDQAKEKKVRKPKKSFSEIGIQYDENDFRDMLFENNAKVIQEEAKSELNSLSLEVEEKSKNNSSNISEISNIVTEDNENNLNNVVNDEQKNKKDDNGKNKKSLSLSSSPTNKQRKTFPFTQQKQKPNTTERKTIATAIKNANLKNLPIKNVSVKTKKTPPKPFEPRKSVPVYFEKTTAIQKSSNSANHCTANNYDPCQYNCAHINVCHRNSLQKQNCPASQNYNYCHNCCKMKCY